ncbi:hypothetical protein [Hyalangium rubrum]|uniref:Transporter n=1 Tax=Hyalangium rubrum TaxID=3103134 RepID=A0ABU5H0X6_9BACT|nr:hypothetical protein [Hyalangium sp. s54d21]MDY7227103.1 hypothetical protein [Hyalangium sp. s54d21]
MALRTWMRPGSGGTALAVAVLLFAPTALAAKVSLLNLGTGPDDVVISPGVLGTLSTRPGGSVTSLGAELSIYKSIPESRIPASTVGAFMQWQRVGSDHHRFSGGIQAGALIFGMELGGTYETAGEERAATASLHLAPYVSIGYVALSVRFGIPVWTRGDDRPGHGHDIGLSLALKLPITVGPD